jgi:hypothetical protein
MNIPEKIKSLKNAFAERSHVRKTLRGPADLCYAIADSIGMLDRGAWDHLVKDAGFFLSAGYLASVEQVLPHNLSPRYALVYSGAGAERQPVAAIYMQIAEVSVAQMRPEKPEPQAGSRAAPLDQLAQNTKQRILTCGNLLTFGQHGIAFAKDVDQKLAWHGVAEVLYRVRQAEKLAGKTHFVMIKDLHSPYREHAAHLENLSYRYVETEPNMVLALSPDWKNHEDYLASLASKYRGNFRNAIMKVMDEGACTMEQVTDMAAVQDQIHALYKEVQVNAGVRLFELVPEYFAMLQRAAGGRHRGGLPYRLRPRRRGRPADLPAPAARRDRRRHFDGLQRDFVRPHRARTESGAGRQAAAVRHPGAAPPAGAQQDDEAPVDRDRARGSARAQPVQKAQGRIGPAPPALA